MCGNNDHTHDTIPAPPPVRSRVPNRHQIRHAIRKVARTMRKHGDMTMGLFVERAMDAGEWSALPTPDYVKTADMMEKAVKASTFFTKEEVEGCHSTVTWLKLRKTAVL